MSNRKTHTVQQVDRENAASYVEGYGDCYVMITDAIGDTLKQINTVMGIYMSDDLNRYRDRVEELSLMHTTIRSIDEIIQDRYDRELPALKEILGEDNY